LLDVVYAAYTVFAILRASSSGRLLSCLSCRPSKKKMSVCLPLASVARQGP
jgi:hypothetical protein